MGARKTSGADLPAMRPALTPEARENQMISLAMDLVEKRIREGTASSAETTHFLKLATSKTMLEKQKLEEENKLLRAKTEAINAAKDNEELYLEVLKAMKEYSGEEFWFSEYGGVNEKQDNMVWAVFFATVTFLIAGAFAMDHGYI